MNPIFLIIFLSLFSCSSPKQSDTEQTNNNFATTECSKLYPFQSYYIDLDENNSVLIDGLPATDFKTCSKYARRFKNIISDSVSLNGKLFVVEYDNDKGIYKINISEDNKKIGSIDLPVENPLPEVREYYIHLLPYKDNVIMFMNDMYGTDYIICKYNADGKELMRTTIEHTFITHPEPNTNYMHPYLYLSGFTGTQMIFSSNVGFSEKDKTVVLSMDNFSKTEYDKTANGLILDENEMNLAGFISSNDDKFKIQMLDGKKYDFEIKNGDPACECLLSGNLLYIANYHPIATGSSLQCFDFSTGKMKWTADVKQVNASHSEYANKVTLSMYKDKIIMEGNESYGSYVQIFDAASGKRLADFGDFIDIGE
jgi:outer membrane protein assembly factor BamB